VSVFPYRMTGARAVRLAVTLVAIRVTAIAIFQARAFATGAKLTTVHLTVLVSAFIGAERAVAIRVRTSFFVHDCHLLPSETHVLCHCVSHGVLASAPIS
jgi:hypothetical protein